MIEYLSLSADTFLYDVNVTYNYGASTTLYVGNGQNGIAVALLKFDLSGVPAEITAADLVLFLGGLTEDSSLISAYRILSANADWIEGTKTGASAGPTEPSWNQRTSSDSWAGSVGMSTSGTDYAATPLGTLASVAYTDVPKYVTIPLIAAEIEKMRDGTYTNGGIVLRSAYENTQNLAIFASEQYGTEAYRPVLEVTYTAPEPVFGPPVQWM